MRGHDAQEFVREGMLPHAILCKQLGEAAVGFFHGALGAASKIDVVHS